MEDFRKNKPIPSPAIPIQLKKEQYAELGNGIKVIVVENHKLPRITVQLIIDRGIECEAPITGIESMTGQLLAYGNQKNTKFDWDAKIDFWGGIVRTSSQGGHASALKKHFAQVFELFSDAILFPSFNIEDFDNLRRKYLSNIQSQKSDPDAILSSLTKKVIFPESHPYSEVITEESIKSIQLDNCIEWHATHFLPNASYLLFEGDITLEEAKDLSQRYFGKWEKKVLNLKSYPNNASKDSFDVSFVEKPGSVQSLISIGFAVDIKPYSKDMVAVNVMNTLLGGFFSSRLNLNLRESKGYTYGIQSTLKTDEYLGYFTTSANVRNEVTSEALNQIIAEINRLRNEIVGEDELQMVKNVVAGNFSRSIENPLTIVKFAFAKKKFNLPSDYFENQIMYIQAVTSDDIIRVANKYLLADSLHIMVVGSPEVIEKLQSFGKVNLYDYQGDIIN